MAYGWVSSMDGRGSPGRQPALWVAVVRAIAISKVGGSWRGSEAQVQKAVGRSTGAKEMDGRRQRRADPSLPSRTLRAVVAARRACVCSRTPVSPSPI